MNFTNGSNSTVYFMLFYVNPNPNMQNPVQIVMFYLLSLLLISVALSSNSFIIMSLLKKSPVNASHHLIINLCFADIVKCLLFVATYNVSMVNDSWQLGTWLCKILPGLYRGYLYYSVTVLSCLARQRYRAIVHPLTHNQKIAKTYIILSCYWVFCISLEVVRNIMQYEVDDLRGEARCLHAYSAPRPNSYDNYLMSMAIDCAVSFVVTQTEFLFYYVKIRMLLRRNSKSFRENNAAATSQRIQRNRRATNTVLASVLAYNFIMFPGLALNLVGVAYREFDLSVLREWGELWMLVYSCINPVLFIWRNNELKSAWKSFVKKMGNSNGN